MEAQNKYNTQNIFENLNVSSTNTFKTNEEISTEDIEKAKSVLELATTKENLASKTQDREERRKFAKKIFWVVVSYLAIVLIIVFFNGIGFTNISNTVIVTLLGTTTANVITLLVIVVKYLFHSKD